MYISDAEPCEEERLLYSDVAEVLRGSHQVIHDLQQYKGAAKEIKEVSIVLCLFYKQAH